MEDLLRSLLLYASKSKALQNIATNWPLVKNVSKRFVAGSTLDEAASAVQALNDEGIIASLDHLGESVETVEEAQEAADACLEILDTINEYDLDANLSLKLTQLGFDVDEQFCEERVREIVGRAESYGNTVRIDMEGSEHTQRTLDLYYRLREDFHNVGVVIQTMLYRSIEDIEQLIDVGVNVRLCKGAYKEAEDIAYPEKADVDQAFRDIEDLLFDKYAMERGVRPCIATHDENIVSYTCMLAEDNKVPKENFEFQMLYGIRNDLQRELKDQGYTVRTYVPYGEHWYPYFVRRLAERPANLWFFVKNLFKK